MATTMFKRAMTLLGLAEDYDDEYDDLVDEPARADRADRADRDRGDRDRGDRGERGERGRGDAVPARPEPSNVRRIAPSRAEPTGTVRPVPSGKVHLTDPTTFNDVEEVGERFRNGIPVIMNLAGASESTAKRLLDFASGLVFGLDGRIEGVGDRVFLLTPMGVDVSTEERRKLTERGFFNQA